MAGALSSRRTCARCDPVARRLRTFDYTLVDPVPLLADYDAVLYHLGDLQVRLRRRDAAEEHFRAALDLDPEHPAESWSSVSYQVAILARCAVLLVK